jgi:hypothetical protein
MGKGDGGAKRASSSKAAEALAARGGTVSGFGGYVALFYTENIQHSSELHDPCGRHVCLSTATACRCDTHPILCLTNFAGSLVQVQLLQQHLVGLPLAQLQLHV